MLFQIKSYLKFLWHSKNEHAVHSPFVFNLITKCFYDTKPKLDPSGSEQTKQYTILKRYKNSLLENKNTIGVPDLGAGSKVIKVDSIKISKIVKTIGISRKRAKLLFRITNYFQPETILEIGTSLGLATSALALGNPKAKIITLEDCLTTMALAKNQLQLFNFDNVECITTNFKDYLQICNLQPTIFNLIFFDADHPKTNTLHYFELLLPTICNETLWIFDDIHLSAEMEAAWEIIKKNPKVTVTIDTYQWGLVFFRREQEKEHFVIRI